MRMASLISLAAGLMTAVIGCSSSDDRPRALGEMPLGTIGGNPGPETWSWGTCPEGFISRCATVEVPLDWSAPDGETISLLVARRPALAQRTGQIWMLQGGPGGSGADLEQLVELYAQLDENVDVYTLDHRGVGHSTRLGCAAEESPESEWGHRVSPDEFPSCLASVQGEWGNHLEYFNTTQAARDLAYVIEQTRQSGESAVVLGFSYGTYWALRYLQVAPAQATGVILDSIAPPSFFISGFDTQFDPVGRELMKACDGDAACGSRLGPDSWTRLQSIFALADAGHCADTKLDRASLRAVLSSLLMSWEGRVYAPAFAYRFERCDPADVQALTHFGEALVGESSPTDALYSDVLHHHVSLSELWETPPPTLEQLEQVLDESMFAPGYGPRVGAQYDRWPRYLKDGFVDAWPSTSVPLLMLNGSMDPQTPLATARAVQDHFTGEYQHFVAVENAAHTVAVQSPVRSAASLPCGLQLIMAFGANPTAALDTSCLQDLQGISFEGDMQLLQALFGVASMWDNPGARSGLVPGSSPVKPVDWRRAAETARRRIVRGKRFVDSHEHE